MGPNMAPCLPFEFPPGHVITIVSIILDLQKRLGCGLNHGEVKAKPSKKRKIESSADTDSNEDDIPAVKADIRNKVHKWIKGYDKGQLCSLKENIDYTIIVSRSASDPTSHSVSIRCGCNKAYVLHR